MLISDALNKAFNTQIGNELGASNQYLNIATYFDGEALPKLAGFFYRQSDEERAHAMKFVHYIMEAGGTVAVPGIPEPPADIKSAEHAVQMALDWELEVTRQINGLMDQAISENDHIAREFLGWFVSEQLEEVGTMDDLLKVTKRAGDRLMYVEEYLEHEGEPHAAEGA